MPNNKKRENWIDTAKAIAMILIILGHVGISLEGWFSFYFVFGFHLIVFFMLSGYTFQIGPLSLDYVTQKFRRLMTPYFITCVVVLLKDVMNEYVVIHHSSVIDITRVIAKDLIRLFYASGTYTDIVTDVDMGVRIGAIWFLPGLFFALILFRFLSNFIKNNKILGLVTLLLGVTAYLTARFVWLPFSIQSGMFAVFFIWLGYSVKKNDLLSKIQWFHYVLGFVILLAGIITDYNYMGFVTANARDYLFSSVIGLGGTLIVYLLATWTEKSKLLQWIGRNSLTILCVHLVSIETFYLPRIFRLLGLKGNALIWSQIPMEILVALLGTFLLNLIRDKMYQSIKAKLLLREEKRLSVQNNSDSAAGHAVSKKRDSSIDICRGLLIISMLVGHFTIDETLRIIIYSCHMVAFVFLSGYFYKKTASIWKGIRHMLRTFLLPYFICFLLNLLIEIPNWSATFFLDTVKKYVLGISFTDRILSGSASVGPVYFILLLFVVRVIYLLIDRYIKSEIGTWIAVILCLLAGIGLGRLGIWLPWSIDVSLYCVFFYKFGILFRQQRLLKAVHEYPWVYFILSAIWAYQIYKGGMEIAIREYGGKGLYSIVLLGALAGILVIYQLSSYICHSMIFTAAVLKVIGEASLIIIIVHGLLSKTVYHFVSVFLTPGYILFMIVNIIIQVVLGVLIHLLIQVLNLYTKKEALV